MSDLNFSRIAIQITGDNGTVSKMFRYSNSGFTALLGDDSEFMYYAPNLDNSILIKNVANIDAIIPEGSKDGFSLKLINLDGSLDVLADYMFDGYDISIFLSMDNSPNPTKFHVLFDGKIESLTVRHKVVDIKAVSPFDIFDIPLNPYSFSGVEDDYEGTSEIAGIVKPRLFGKVFNISPVPLKTNTNLYGISWDINGDRDVLISIDAVRDGGLPLVLDSGASGSINGDYATTALMDVVTPASGHYITCLVEGTFKLNGTPVYGVTADVEQSENTYTAWITKLNSELNLAGFHLLNIPTYTLGYYVTSSETYTAVDATLRSSLSIFKWFGFDGSLYAASYGDLSLETPVVNFIYSGLNLTDSEDVPVLSIVREKYIKPYNSLNSKYRKNYTVQTLSQLASGVDEYDTILFGMENRMSSNLQFMYTNPYAQRSHYENETVIYETDDSIDFALDWMSLRNKTIDIKKIVCPILSANSNVILGVVEDGDTSSLNMSSTDGPVVPATSDIVGMSASSTTLPYGMSHNNTDFSGQRTLRLGDVVSLTSDRFDEDALKHIVTSSEINTRTRQVTYGLLSKRVY